jgi:methionyl-tRNA formyltransferase
MVFFGNPRTREYYKDFVEKNEAEPVLVSCQYPHKIKVSDRTVPCVNVHYGLLPYYRGMYPIYHQMMNSESVGVTLHYMTDNFDDGDIIDFYSFPHYGKTANECYDECEKRGLELIRAWLPKILDGTAPRQKQDEGFATYYDKDSVDWGKAKKINGIFISTEDKNRDIFATHFEGKQYPEIRLNGRLFELRAK